MKDNNAKALARHWIPACAGMTNHRIVDLNDCKVERRPSLQDTKRAFLEVCRMAVIDTIAAKLTIICALRVY